MDRYILDGQYGKYLEMIGVRVGEALKAAGVPEDLFSRKKPVLEEDAYYRFMEAVGNFTSETQFIIISHSKRTMSMVDTIYGVTQEQPGVSTRYSLKLTNDYEGKLRGESDAEGEGEGAPAAEEAAASPA